MMDTEKRGKNFLKNAGEALRDNFLQTTYVPRKSCPDTDSGSCSACAMKCARYLETLQGGAPASGNTAPAAGVPASETAAAETSAPTAAETAAAPSPASSFEERNAPAAIASGAADPPLPETTFPFPQIIAAITGFVLGSFLSRAFLGLFR